MSYDGTAREKRVTILLGQLRKLNFYRTKGERLLALLAEAVLADMDRVCGHVRRIDPTPPLQHGQYEASNPNNPVTYIRRMKCKP